jgi:flotillin
MDPVQSLLQLAWAVPVGILVILVIIALIYARSKWKVAKADEALVITGGKNGMRIRAGGGGFVSPLHQHQFFPLGVMTVRSLNQETQSKTLIPVVVQWTAQLRPNTDDPKTLESAVVGFIDKSVDEIKDSLQQTLDGEVRGVVATMTPEEVVTNKESFSTQVTSNVEQRMNELGYKLISLNIAEVSDKNDYYKNLSAPDREDRRKTAETLKATANQEVAVAQADSDRISQSAVLDRDLAIAEKNREVSLRQAGIKAETDIAQTDAEYAGQVQAQDREAELAARRGHVNVVQQEQARAEAIARREVTVTEAETAKQENAIQAESEARRQEIEAEAAANVAKSQAAGEANANIERARGEAEATTARASANAEQTRLTGLANAEIARAAGEAEAAAILAKGSAEAEVQKLQAEALAANEGANLQVRIAEIQSETQIKISTSVGEVMARIGEKAQFIDMGGSGAKDGGDLLTSVLGNVPRLFKSLNIENQALNGTPIGAMLGSFLTDLRTSNDSAPTPGTDVVAPAATPTQEAAPQSNADEASEDDTKDPPLPVG